jgi:hypothetical protein
MLFPYSGFQFLFFLREYPSNLWTLPTFSEASNMSREDLTAPVDAAATAQVKLCPYDEEEPHIWFCLIEAEFAAAGIKSQKLKYASALASLPKQVLWDILDTLDVCNDSAELFNYLKNTLLRQFGKSKWQSYFELLRLPMEMQGLKPSGALMGKLNQHLPPGVSPDNDLFLSMFLIHLLPSMREVEGAGTHKMAAAMVKAADALWDARGGHNPTVAAASPQRSRSPAPNSGKRGDRQSGNNRSKSHPPYRPDFYSFQNPGNGVCKFDNYYAHKAHRCASPVLGRKSSLPLNHLRFGGQPNTRYYHGHALPCQRWIDFLNGRIDK